MKLTLHTKLNALAGVTLIPCTAIIIYLIYSLISYCNAYNQIVVSITYLHEYNINFKENIDYAAYRLFIGMADPWELDDNPDIVNPYREIDRAREAFQELSEITSVRSNETRIKGMINSVNSLEKNLNHLLANIREGGKYDENKDYWELNICGVTELIQDIIVDCIYYESANMIGVQKELEAKEAQTIRLVTILLAAVLTVVLLIALKLSGSIADPIERLCRATELVSAGDFSIRAKEVSGNEVAILTTSFNRMIGRIGELIEDIKAEQRNQRATELKLLQAQINPHFLYNTLDTISWLAEGQKTEQVVSLIASLSHFFRTSLSKGRDFITVWEEQSHIKSYLEIQQFRYQDILEYEIDIEESIGHCGILKLTLQPLVENALYHGIKNKRGMGKITVTGRREGAQLLFVVADNGIGMEAGRCRELMEVIKGRRTGEQGAGGFGLPNVDERIRLNYGREYGLFITSEYGRGTRISVIIPAREAQEGEGGINQ